MQWRRDVAFAGYQVNIQMDISAEKMIFGVTDVDPQRRDELIKASSFRIGRTNKFISLSDFTWKTES
jgi:CCR4-NOT complex subunit CAF16